MAQFTSFNSIKCKHMSVFYFIISNVFTNKHSISNMSDLEAIDINGKLITGYGDSFQANFNYWWLRYQLWNCSQMNVIGTYSWWVNTGLCNGLVPPGNKPLAEPILTQMYLAI